MVETITPVVHGGRRGRWAAAVALHAAGATVAAAAFGAALGGVGAALGAPWGAAGLAAVAVLGLAYLGHEVLGWRVPVPALRRQVPDWWRTYFPFTPAAVLYGVGLGIGFLTFLSHGTLVVVAAAAVSTGRPGTGALIIAPFGLARGVSAVVSMRVRSSEEGAALVARLADAADRRVWRFAHAIVLLSVVAAAGIELPGAPVPGRAGEVAAAVLALAFGAAFVAKLARPRRWARALASYRLGALEGPALVFVPAVELGIAVLPFLGLRSSAGVAALAVLAAFSGAIVLGRVRSGRVLDCGCFGGAAARDYRWPLARNGVLVAVAVVAWRAGADAWAFGRVAAPTGSDLVPASLVVVGLAVAIWVSVRAALAVRRAGGG